MICLSRTYPVSSDLYIHTPYDSNLYYSNARFDNLYYVKNGNTGSSLYTSTYASIYAKRGPFHGKTSPSFSPTKLLSLLIWGPRHGSVLGRHPPALRCPPPRPAKANRGNAHPPAISSEVLWGAGGGKTCGSVVLWSFSLGRQRPLILSHRKHIE